MMRFTQVKETSLYVKDLNRTVRFHEGILGFEVINLVSDRHAFFRCGTSILLCFLAETTLKDTKLPPHGASGQIHLAFEIPFDNYQECKEFFMIKGISIIHEQEWGVGLCSFYFHDPDGHLLEVVPTGLWDPKP